VVRIATHREKDSVSLSSLDVAARSKYRPTPYILYRRCGLASPTFTSPEEARFGHHRRLRRTGIARTTGDARTMSVFSSSAGGSERISNYNQAPDSQCLAGGIFSKSIQKMKELGDTVGAVEPKYCPDSRREAARWRWLFRIRNFSRVVGRLNQRKPSQQSQQRQLWTESFIAVRLPGACGSMSSVQVLVFMPKPLDITIAEESRLCWNCQHLHHLIRAIGDARKIDVPATDKQVRAAPHPSRLRDRWFIKTVTQRRRKRHISFQ